MALVIAVTLAATAAVATPMIAAVEDWAGWLLLYATFVILFSFREIRSSPALMVVATLALALRHAVALVNAYVTTVPGADLDAASFHIAGVKMANGSPLEEYENWVYSRALAFFYRPFGESLLLGEQLSIVAWVLSVGIFLKLLVRTGAWQHRVGTMAIFSFAPSLVIFSAITMREAWQALLLLVIVYSAVTLRESRTWSSLLMFIGGCAALTILHHGLAVYAAFIVPVGLYWAFGEQVRQGMHRRRRAARLIGILLAAILLIGWKMLASRLGAAAGAVLSGKLLEYAGAFRESAADLGARTAFGVHLDVSSILGLISTAPLVFLAYMFAPWPWQIATTLDVVVFSESVLRLVLLVGAFRHFRASTGDTRATLGFIMLAFFALEAIWAVGTLNWGTATRHHVPGYALLLVCGGAGVFGAVTSALRRILPRTSATGTPSTAHAAPFAQGQHRVVDPIR